MKILYLTGMLPVRMVNGTEIATRMILDALVGLGHDVTLAGYLRPNDPEPSGFPSIVLDRRPIEAARASTSQRLSWSADALLRNEPISVAKFRSRRGRALLNAELKTGYDLVLADKPQMAWLFRQSLEGQRVGVVWHAIEHKTYGGVAEEKSGLSRQIYRREAAFSERLERAVAAEVGHVFVLTDTDAEALRKLGYAGPLDVLPLTVPVHPEPQPQPPAFTHDVGLLGSWTWSANAGGLEWFLRQVVPLLDPTWSVAVAGMGSEGIAPKSPMVTHLDFVEDARVFLSSCRVVAIPLLTGTGVSMKLLEAACEGWPTVTTTVGARGVNNLPASVHVTDEPEGFAAALAAMAKTPAGQRDAWAAAGARWMQERGALLTQTLASGMSDLARDSSRAPTASPLRFTMAAGT